MNYLGHSIMTYPYEAVTVGNLIGDMVHSRDLPGLSAPMRLGVEVHRVIDSATDHHPLVKELVAMMRPSQGKYAPVALDIVLDHIITRNWMALMAIDLDTFEEWVYTSIRQNRSDVPRHYRTRIGRMARYRWLGAYGTIPGIRDVLDRMDHRAQFPSNFTLATNVMQEHMPAFDQSIVTIVHDVRSTVEQQLQSNLLGGLKS